MAKSTELPSIFESANPDRNTAMGGHITQHIRGMTPPPGKKQEGKTLFGKRSDMEAAWRQYTYHSAGVTCSGKQAQQEMTMAQLKMGMIEAWSCTAVDGQGRSTQATMYIADSIFFGFLLVEGTWILNTCYPVPLT